MPPPEEIHELNGFATESVADISAGLLVRAGKTAPSSPTACSTT